MMATAGDAAAGVGIALLVGAYIVVIFGSLAFMIVALVDIVRRPDWQWKLAGQEKVLWIILVLVVNFLAIPSFIYWFSIRKKLLAVESAAAAGAYGPGRMGFSGWEPAPAPTWGPTGPGGVAPVAPAPPAWLPDPSGQHLLRWWDGLRWTEHVHDATGPEASTVAPA